MTKRSASFSTNCPDQYLQVGVVLDGVSNILATAEKLAEVDKVTPSFYTFSLSLSVFLLKGRNDGGRVWRTR